MTQPTHNDVFSFSNHAITRMAQRGIRIDFLDILLMHGTASNAGGGREQYRLLHRTVRQLRIDGHDAQTLHAAVKLCAVVSADGTVVTCYHGKSPARLRSGGRARQSQSGWRQDTSEAGS